MTWDSLHKVFTEVTGFFTTIILTVQHGEEVVERIMGWIGLRTLIARKGERRHLMGNVLADLQLAIAAAAELKTALPLLGQAAADLKQAFTDKSDPTKASADVAAALAVVLPLIEQILPLLPAANVPTPSTTSPTPPAAA